jgi:fatty acid desaturase
MDLIADSNGLSFLEQQVSASRNIEGGLITDIILVGLNRQVEHHLFPNCPRNKLRLIRPYLEATCSRMGLECVEAGIIETNRAILRELSLATKLRECD